MEKIQRKLEKMVYVDFVDNDGKKASCPECGNVIKFDPFYKYDNYCNYCECHIDSDANIKKIMDEGESFISEYSMEIEDNKLIVNAVLETPDFWEAEYGDTIECDYDEITIIVDHNTGITNTFEGAAKVDYSNGLSNYDVLLCLLKSEEFVNDFKKMAIIVVSRPDDFFDGIEDDEIFDFTFIANRYPFFSKKQLDRIIHSDHSSKIYTIIRKIAYNDDETTIIQKLEEECGVKFSKNVIKRFVSNPAMLYDIALFGEMFTNIDLLNRFIDSGLSSVINDCSTSFVNRMIEIRGEVNAMNFFIKSLSDFSLIKDASNFYSELLFENKSLLTDDIMKGTPVEVHDRLSAIRQTIRYPNKTIHYMDEERERYCKKIDAITFSLPPTTHSLIKIGHALHNCVANYAEKAETKQCTIIVMYEDKDIVGCIEVDAEGKNVIQARGYCNELLFGQYLIAFNKYAELIGLSTVNCNILNPEELVEIDGDEEDIYDIDFHELELDENGNVIEV